MDLKWNGNVLQLQVSNYDSDHQGYGKSHMVQTTTDAPGAERIRAMTVVFLPLSGGKTPFILIVWMFTNTQSAALGMYYIKYNNLFFASFDKMNLGHCRIIYNYIVTHITGYRYLGQIKHTPVQWRLVGGGGGGGGGGGVFALSGDSQQLSVKVGWFGGFFTIGWQSGTFGNMNLMK